VKIYLLLVLADGSSGTAFPLPFESVGSSWVVERVCLSEDVRAVDAASSFAAFTLALNLVCRVSVAGCRWVDAEEADE
jgi:hypothetical protein